MTEATVSTVSTASDRRSYRCYHCNNAFHITTTVGVSSSFRCPCCFHRHLLPSYTIVSVSPLPQPQPSTPDFTLSTTNSLTFDFSDSETENDDSDSDDLSLELFFSPQFRAQTLKSFIDSLPSVKIDESLKNCSICLEEFEIDKVASELPCKHFFHNNCIVPWLNRNNTCPLCRHELPQEDVGELEKEQQAFLDSVYNLVALVPMPSSLGLSEVGEDVHDPRARERDLDEMRDEDGDVMMVDA